MKHVSIFLFLIAMSYAGICNTDQNNSEEQQSKVDIGLQPLDSVMKRVDPLVFFPGLSSMGTVAVPKGYIVLLVGFLLTGGILIFVADVVQTQRRRKHTRLKKHGKARRVVGALKMQMAFETFVVTLFDPLYFRFRRMKAPRVLVGNGGERETPADLEFEFDYRDTHARFAVKCLYFTTTMKGDIHLFSGTRQLTSTSLENEVPLYFILGFGGTPDDPKELFLLPGKEAKREVIRKESLTPYSKSGMFFYNSVAGRLQ